MRKLALFAGGFSAAVFLWRYGLWPVAAVCAAVCLLVGVLLRSRRALFALLLGGMAVGLVWSGLYSHFTLSPWESLHKKKDVTLQVRIDGWAQTDERGQRVADARFTDLERERSVNGVVYLPGDTEILPGDVLEVCGTVYLADRLSGGEITYYSSRGDFLRVYVSEVTAKYRPENASLRTLPLRVSRAVKENLAAVLDENCAPLASALVLGDKSGLDDYFLSCARRAGVAHVIAVSGMHVGFLAGLMAVFLGRRKRSAVVLTLLLLAFFALMAGGTPSAWRAVLLCSASLAAPLAGRENDPPTSLLTALMILLLINPFSAASPGLQLSFAAVAGIELLTPGLMKRWSPKRPKGATVGEWLWWKVRVWFAGALAVSLGAVLLTTPLSALWFGSVSLIGPLTNLLTLWAVSGAFVLSVISAALTFVFPAAAAVPAVPCALFLRYLLWVIPLLGSLPFASVTMTSFYYAFGLLVLYILLCLNLFWPGKKRLRVPLLCCGVIVALCVSFTRLEFRLGDLTVAVLDVGQGQSVCIQSGGYTVLVDCGGGGGSNAGDVAADYLADQGVDTVDLLILTHYHADHTNGIDELFDRVQVREIALPDVEREDSLRRRVLKQAEEEGAGITYITEHVTYPLEDGQLKIYAPLGGGGSNEMGLAVLATAGTYDALITGDMNTTVEQRLVKYGALPDIELLVVGHHGSASSTGEELLRAVRPETAVISVGANNSYGHPTREVLERLAQYEITIYRTDLIGTVVIHTKGE